MQITLRNRLHSALLFILIFLIINSSFSVTPVKAQQTTKLDSILTEFFKYSIKPLIVTAIRISLPIYDVPHAVDILSKENIQRAKLQLSLEESLREVPGVQVNNRNNFSQGDRISIRGIGSRASFGVRGIKIILDNIPLTMPDGQSQLNNLDLGSVGNIEVLRGPNSSLYGNASGGVLNIQTEFPSDRAFLFSPRFTFGTYGMRKLQAKTSLHLNNHEVLANFSNLKIDGYRDHSAASMNSLNIVGRHKLGKHLRLNTVFNYYDSPYLLNPSSLSKDAAESDPQQTRTFVKKQGAGKEVQQTQGGISLVHGQNQEKFEFTIYGISRSLFNLIPGRIIDLTRKAGGVRSVFSKKFNNEVLDFRLTAGVDLESQSDDRIEFENDGLPGDLHETLKGEEFLKQVRYGANLLYQNERVIGIGPFVKLEFSLQHNLLLTLGGRYDRFQFKVDDDFFEDGIDYSDERMMSQFSPTIGLTYHMKLLSSLFANYSTSFQTPTTTELSNQPSGAGGFNPILEPENIESFELGVKGISLEKKINYDIAFYLLRIKNMLIPYQVEDPESEEIFFRNAGKANNFGIEFKSTWTPTSKFKFIFSYSYMHFVFKDFIVESSSTGDLKQLAENKIPGISPHRIFAGIIYEHNSGFYTELDIKWNDGYFTNDLNGPPAGNNLSIQTFTNPAYYLVDFRFGIQQKLGDFSVDLYMGINNLLDKKYNGSIVPNAFGNRFFEPAPGRNYYGGISLPVSILK